MLQLRTGLLGICLAIASVFPAFGGAPAPTAQTLHKSFIWTPAVKTGQQAYVVFRKAFKLEQKPTTATLHIFADSRYILWINGQYVERGPCRFDPLGPDYDTLDVARFLQAGDNVVAVLVHHYHDGKPTNNGDSFGGRMMRHAPGLTALLETTDGQGRKQSLLTDAAWRSNAENRFGPSPISWSSIADNIDARRDKGDWTATAFDDSTWTPAVAIDGKQWGTLRPRHIALLRETEVPPLHVVQQKSGDAAPKNLADEPELAKLLPLELTANSEIIVDARQFVQAYCVVDMEAEAGSRLAFTYGQGFLDTGHNFTGQGVQSSQYVTRQGRQVYMSGDTFGCKYVQIRCVAGKVRLLGMKLINRVYPFDVVGKFVSNDKLLNDIWQVGINTIRIVSEDAYVDCATRERVEWLGDGVVVSYPVSRFTMAGPGPDGKPSWSDPRLIGSMLRHMGQSVGPDGRVKAHHPSNRWDIHGYIEDYSCLWIMGVREWQRNTGQLDLVREVWPAVTAQLKWFLDHRTELGLVRAREFVFPGNPLLYKVCQGATLNEFVARALGDAAELAAKLGDTAHAQEYAAAHASLVKAINKNLWDKDAAAYIAGIKDDGERLPPTVHANMLAMFCDVVPAERRQRMEQWLMVNMDGREFSPFQYAYAFEVWADMDTDAADRKALKLIREHWAPMTRFEARTSWEGFGPGENCHDMGSTPTIYLSRHVLGVELAGDVGNRRLVVAPHLGDLPQVEGVVVTELGPVPVSWKRAKEKGPLTFTIEVPQGATARLLLRRTDAEAGVQIDGQKATPTEKTASRIGFLLKAGKHQGETLGPAAP